jgi:folate-binding protein YgfZ
MPERTPFHDVAASSGATFVDDAGWLMPAGYGDVAAEYRQAREGAALFDVSHRGKIEVTGPETARFLHNLCTNDILNLPVGKGCEAFFTTNKARVVAPALVYHLRLPESGDTFWMDIAPGLAGKALQHLDRYRISEQVEFTERTTEFAQLHLAGPQAHGVLAQALNSEVPDLAELQALAQDVGGVPLQVRRVDVLGLPGYDVLCPRSAATDLWQRLLGARARPAGLEGYHILRVEAGTPIWGADIDENRLVMEIGRTARAICYTKGCYLGQEPIVMARDRGHVNRTLLGVTVPGEGPVPPGAKVLRGGEEVGQVASSVVSPRLGPIALAYLRRGSQEPGTAVEVESAAGRRTAAVVSLPFLGVGVGAGGGTV